MKYINKFSTNADYQAFTEGGYVTPNVCYVTESKGLKFKPKEKSAPVLITFTVNGIEYQSEEGMTWKEWCNSEYNTAGFIYDRTENRDGIYTSDYEEYFIFGLNENSLVTTDRYITKKVNWPLI
jgi:hypothetical protein